MSNMYIQASTTQIETLIALNYVNTKINTRKLLGIP